MLTISRSQHHVCPEPLDHDVAGLGDDYSSIHSLQKSGLDRYAQTVDCTILPGLVAVPFIFS